MEAEPRGLPGTTGSWLKLVTSFVAAYCTNCWTILRQLWNFLKVRLHAAAYSRSRLTSENGRPSLLVFRESTKGSFVVVEQLSAIGIDAG